MNQEQSFSYRYSAKENKEIQEIRKKYLPQGESKLEELKRLDGVVQNSGMIESLCVGIGGLLVFGLGMCLAMQVIGSGVLMIGLGVLVGLVGMAAMVAAYPVYRAVFNKTKEKYTQRILELTEELSGEV
ncbi:MAG: hypothetical protein IJX63_10195 [Lachnospiraceae bacterium]|nr:hypothetical protein [Lachnospiraceae bacterium]